MIYEVRTYTLKPGSVAEVEKRFGEALPHRQKYSPLAGLWHTEFGPLNQVIHIWGYENAQQRAEIRAQAAKDPNWPPHIHEFVDEQVSEIYNPAPFMKPMQPGTYGPVYEMRTYTFRPGTIPTVIQRWGEKIEARTKYSPLVACMYTENGPLNRWVHIWSYKSVEERNRVREEAAKSGNWPPGTREFLVKQENKVIIPAACSPMQ